MSIQLTGLHKSATGGLLFDRLLYNKPVQLQYSVYKRGFISQGYSIKAIVSIKGKLHSCTQAQKPFITICMTFTFTVCPYCT